MNIIDALKTNDIMLSYGNCWMYFNDDKWVVIEHLFYKKKRILIKTKNEEKAIDILLKQ